MPSGWTYKPILRHYYTGISFGKTSNRTVRVLPASGQRGARELESCLQGERRWAQCESPRRQGRDPHRSNSAYRVTAGGRSWDFTVLSRSSPALVSCVSTTATRTAGLRAQSGARYRGNLRVVRRSGAFRIVNHVKLEGYFAEWCRASRRLHGQEKLSGRSPCGSLLRRSRHQGRRHLRSLLYRRQPGLQRLRRRG